MGCNLAGEKRLMILMTTRRSEQHARKNQAPQPLRIKNRCLTNTPTESHAKTTPKRRQNDAKAAMAGLLGSDAKTTPSARARGVPAQQTEVRRRSYTA